jgi:hypothetical protein
VSLRGTHLQAAHTFVDDDSNLAWFIDCSSYLRVSLKDASGAVRFLAQAPAGEPDLACAYENMQSSWADLPSEPI